MAQDPLKCLLLLFRFVIELLDWILHLEAGHDRSQPRCHNLRAVDNFRCPFCSTSNEQDAAVPESPADVVRPLLGEIVGLFGPGGEEGVVEAGAPSSSQSSAPQKPVLGVERSGQAAPQLAAVILLRDKDFQLLISPILFTAADENSYQSYFTGQLEYFRDSTTCWRSRGCRSCC